MFKIEDKFIYIYIYILNSFNLFFSLFIQIWWCDVEITNEQTHSWFLAVPRGVFPSLAFYVLTFGFAGSPEPPVTRNGCESRRRLWPLAAAFPPLSGSPLYFISNTNQHETLRFAVFNYLLLMPSLSQLLGLLASVAQWICETLRFVDCCWNCSLWVQFGCLFDVFTY